MSIDWAWFTEKAPLITAMKDIVLAGAAICTTILAWRALDKWRAETIGRRRLELAELVLTSFYQMREIIEDARNPLVLATEMLPIPGIPDKVILNGIYAVTQRLKPFSDHISDHRTKRHQFAAVFGIEAAKPWDEIEAVLSELHAATGSLIDLGGERPPPDDPNLNFYIAQRQILSRGLSRKKHMDPITSRLDAAVTAIESICRPIIQAAVR